GSERPCREPRNKRRTTTRPSGRSCRTASPKPRSFSRRSSTPTPSGSRIWSPPWRRSSRTRCSAPVCSWAGASTAAGCCSSCAWALIPTFLGLSTVRPGNPGFSTFYLATAALILIVAVAEASYHMAYQDSLTGLPARRALNEALLRLGGQYTVAMLDVDHFKRINDHHGHDVGDQVLKMIAAKLAQV